MQQQPQVEQEWTVRRVLDWTVQHLTEHGAETPRLDAEILLAHSRGCPRIQLYTQYDEPLSHGERTTMRDLVKRRANSEPVAYLVGHREFFGIDFSVTRDALIPRPDTETLVMELLEAAKTFPAPRVLELGTGTGCISIALATNCTQATITATDISSPALQVAKQNAVKHQMGERIRFLEGNLYEPIANEATFEIIVSNPPYVEEGELETLQQEVWKHEPRQALVAGADGLDIIRPLIDQGKSHLVPGGHLMLEIAPEQSAAVSRLFAEAGCFEAIRVVNDLSGLARVVAARKVGS